MRQKGESVAWQVGIWRTLLLTKPLFNPPSISTIRPLFEAPNKHRHLHKPLQYSLLLRQPSLPQSLPLLPRRLLFVLPMVSAQSHSP